MLTARDEGALWRGCPHHREVQCHGYSLITEGRGGLNKRGGSQTLQLERLNKGLGDFTDPRGLRSKGTLSHEHDYPESDHISAIEGSSAN